MTRDARPLDPPVTPALLPVALMLAWLIPGAGHFFLGRRARGAVFCVIVLVSLAVGCALEGELYHDLDQPLAILATLACAGMGLPYFLLLLGLGYTGDIQSAGYEYGKAFILTAGLMNILLILDVWDIARGTKD